jgi:hypothetical protein
MDLGKYYGAIRDLEKSIETDQVVVISKKTDDGGIDGVACEVKRLLAAQLVVEGKARIATVEEQAKYVAGMTPRAAASDQSKRSGEE